MAEPLTLQAHLRSLLDDYEKARADHWRAVTAAPASDRALTQAALDEAAGRWEAACQEMADLFLCLLLHCTIRRKEALALLLAEVTEARRT